MGWTREKKSSQGNTRKNEQGEGGREEEWQRSIVCAGIDSPHCPVRVMWDTARLLPAPPFLLWPCFPQLFFSAGAGEGELWKARRASHVWHCSIQYLPGFLSHAGPLASNAEKDRLYLARVSLSVLIG